MAKDNRMEVIRTVGVTVAKGFLSVNMYSQIYDSVSTLFLRILCIQRARVLQG